MKNKFQSVYERLANSQPYQRVDLKLKAITWITITISAASTAIANGLSHKDRIGEEWAWALGVATFLIVEGALYTLEEGLRSTFKGGTQRSLAWFGKWIIKATMVANAAFLCCMVAGLDVPPALLFWNKWSFAVHFAIGLILIPLIRDADPVIAARMLQLRAETAQEDQIISRLASALASPFALTGARMRGAWDGFKLGMRLLFNRQGFSTKNYVANLNSLSEARFRYVEGARSVLPASSVPAVRLSAPIPAAPLIVPAKQNLKQNSKVLPKTRKSSSVGGVSLPDINLIHFEPNAKGGLEAWFRPSRNSPRSERKYLKHFGQKELSRLSASLDGGEEEIRRTVEEAARQKGIML